MRSLTFLVFVFLTFCCWGFYGPVLHIGQAEIGEDGKPGSLRPFICVGVAYFLIAVLFPTMVLLSKGEKGNWTISGAVWSFISGAVGAVGALGIIFAFKFGGKPVYVMPLVFGCAPIVNTFVTMLMARTFKQASIPFYLGIVIVALGAAGVLTYKPIQNHKTVDAPSEPAASQKTPVVYFSDDDNSVASLSESQAEPRLSEESESVQQTIASDDALLPEAAATLPTSPTSNNSFYVTISIFVTALCWGTYGAVLHKGQAKMHGSRLRPFICVGLAYFAIAVVVPLIALPMYPEPGSFDNTSGVLWSLLAGAVGALGALGIIYAFNAGGKPVFVMPLVFGLAPVVNTFVEMFITKGVADSVSPMFYASLGAVILGAVMVLVFAPRTAPPKPA